MGPINKIKPSHALFLFFLAFYFAINSGFITNADIRIIYMSAKQLLEEGTLYFSCVPDNIAPQTTILSNGLIVSKPSVFLTLLLVPFLLLSKLVSGLSGISEKFTDEFAVAQIFSVAGACCVFFFYKILRRLSGSEKTATKASLIFGALSMMTIYSKRTALEPMFALLLVYTTYRLLKYRENKDIKDIYYASISAGVLLLLKNANIIFFPAFALSLFLFSEKGKRLEAFLKFTPAAVTAVFMILISNYLMTGNAFMSTYGDVGYLFVANPLRGLTGQLFSTEYGLFIYSPMAIAGAVSMYLFIKMYKVEARYLLSLFILNLTFYSFWATPEGGEGVWGPRFLASSEFIFFVSLGCVLPKISKSKIALFTVFILGLYGVLAQTIGTLVYERQYHDIQFRLMQSGYKKSEILSPLRGKYLLLKNKISGKPEIYDLSKFLIKSGTDLKVKIYDQTEHEAFNSLSLWFVFAKNSFNKPAFTFLLYSLLALLALFEVVFMIRIFDIIFTKKRLTV